MNGIAQILYNYLHPHEEREGQPLCFELFLSQMGSLKLLNEYLTSAMVYNSLI